LLRLLWRGIRSRRPGKVRRFPAPASSTGHSHFRMCGRTAMIFAESRRRHSPKSDEPRDWAAAKGLCSRLACSFPTMLWHGGTPLLEGGWHKKSAGPTHFGLRTSSFRSLRSRHNRHVLLWPRQRSPAADTSRLFLKRICLRLRSFPVIGLRLRILEIASDSLEPRRSMPMRGLFSPSDLADAANAQYGLRNTMHNSVGACFRQAASPWHPNSSAIMGQRTSRLAH